jgi:serine/threonine protein kinase
MQKDRPMRGITVNGWRVEPIEGFRADDPEMVDDAVRHLVRAIEGGEGILFHSSRYAVTYLTRIADKTGPTIEVYIKTYRQPRGLTALKQAIRGGRAGNVMRMTEALHQAGFGTPRLLFQGVQLNGGRSLLVTERAEGISLPDLVANLQDDHSCGRKRALMAALGREVARLHRAGFIHGDLTPYNLFVVQTEPPRFIFLDHDRTRLAFPAGRRYRQLRNLVQLGRFDLPGLSNSDRLRVFNAYAADLGIAQPRGLARRVARMLARRRRHNPN